MDTCVIKKLKIDQLQSNAIITLIGRRCTGKSTMLKDIMYHKRTEYYAVLGFAGSIGAYESMATYVAPAFLKHGFDEHSLRQFVGYAKKMKEAQKFGASVKNFCVIIDDCMWDSKIFKSDIVREIFMNGRHFNFTYIIGMQYMMDMPPALRGQIDYVLCAKDGIHSNKRRLHVNFFGIFENIADFNMVLDKCTENYNYLVLDNRVPTTKISACIFWYKAALRQPNFRTSKNIFWRMKPKGTREKFRYKPVGKRIKQIAMV